MPEVYQVLQASGKLVHRLDAVNRFVLIIIAFEHAHGCSRETQREGLVLLNPH